MTGGLYLPQKRRRRRRQVYDELGQCVSDPFDLSYAETYIDQEVPFVMHPVKVSPGEITAAEAFEKKYGDRVRATEEYHGLGPQALRGVLARRKVVCISEDKWVDCPVHVSVRAMRSWYSKFGDGICVAYSSPKGRRDTQVSSHDDLEAAIGPRLRRYMALGFQSRAVLAEYIKREGVIATESTLRKWVDVQGRWTLGDISHCLEYENGKRPCATYKDLMKYHREITRNAFVEGDSVSSIAEWYSTRTNLSVSQNLVRNFLKDHPCRVVSHWEQMLQGSVLAVLREIKNRYTGGEMCPTCVSGATTCCILDTDLLLRDREDREDRNLQHLRIHYTHRKDQAFFVQYLWDEYGVRCDFPAGDLYNVWDYVCDINKPHGALMPCRACGYTFPESDVFLQEGTRRNREAAFVWECEWCVGDGGICAEAARESFRTRWRQNSADSLYWSSRYTYKPLIAGDAGHTVGFVHKKRKAVVARSSAALYERREIVKKLDIGYGLSRYRDLGRPDYELHDEYFHKHGYRVPVPYFLNESNRSRYVGIRSSAPAS